MNALHIIMVTVVHTNPPSPVEDYAEFNYLVDTIAELDPFQDPMVLPGRQCGTNRPLNTVRKLFNQLAESGYPDEYRIIDTVVMGYWESRDEEEWWTPLCVESSGAWTEIRW